MGTAFAFGGFAAFGVGAALLVAGTGPASSAAHDRPQISVTGAYIPEPSSKEVAAYLTVRNAGDAADTLLGVRTDVSTIVMLHRGAGRHMGLVNSVPLPPRGRVALTGGGPHLMIMAPTRRLRKGEWVNVTLVFARSAPVKASALVVGPNEGPPPEPNIGSRHGDHG